MYCEFDSMLKHPIQKHTSIGNIIKW